MISNKGAQFNVASPITRNNPKESIESMKGDDIENDGVEMQDIDGLKQKEVG